MQPMSQTVNVDTIIEKVRDEFKRSPNGMQCVFVAIDEQWGIKLYFNSCKRDECMENQQNCYNVGLAPEVGPPIDLPNGFYRYGYITERAKVAVEGCYGPKHRVWEDQNRIQVQELRAELEERADWYMGDDHAGNFGYIRGKLVPIDFGIDDVEDGYHSKQDNNFDDIENEMLDLYYE